MSLNDENEELRRAQNRQALERIIGREQIIGDGTASGRRQKRMFKKLEKRTAQQFHDLRDALRDTFSKITDRQTVDARARALVPKASVSGRALAIVIIIMTFLASMTAGSVEMISSASSGWNSEIAREMTIQVRPKTNRNLEADLSEAQKIARNSDIVSDVEVYSKAQSEKLLEPWLGTNLPLNQISVPRIMVLKLKSGVDAQLNTSIAALKQNLNTTVPTASLDDHRQWSSRLATMAGAMVFGGLFILCLVLVATTLAIGFATRGAMAGTREIINVLHLVGAEDRFIADEFQRHFLKLGARGGGIGGLLAIITFLAIGKISASMRATPQGDQIEALFGSFSLGLRGFVAIFAIMLLVAALTAIITRVTVYRNLRGLD